MKSFLKSHLRTRLSRVAVLGSLVALVAAGSAFAYFSAQSTGSGTGSAAVGPVPTSISLNWSALEAQSQPVLVPGASDNYAYATNWAGGGKVHIGTITTTVSVDSAHATAGCLAADFSVPPIVVNADETSPFSVPATLTMANTALNQNACAGATLTLTLSSN